MASGRALSDIRPSKITTGPISFQRSLCGEGWRVLEGCRWGQWVAGDGGGPVRRFGVFGFQDLQIAHVEAGELQRNLGANSATADMRQSLLKMKVVFYGAFELPPGFMDDWSPLCVGGVRSEGFVIWRFFVSPLFLLRFSAAFAWFCGYLILYAIVFLKYSKSPNVTQAGGIMQKHHCKDDSLHIEYCVTELP